MKILASIITFNPDLCRLTENISSIINQVDNIVIFDNGSRNILEIESCIKRFKGITLIKFTDNLGIAYALSEALTYAIANKFDWILTLDQDSVCKKSLIEEYVKYISIQNVAIITCKIRDRNMGVNNSVEGDYEKIGYCITSGSFMNVEKYKLLDGFDTDMFIDGVDFDICAQIHRHGFDIIRINYEGILHEVGHGKIVTLFGKNYETYNHSPFRQYYMARNQFYLSYKYPDQFPLLKTIKSEVRKIIIILLYEDNKKEKVYARLKGVLDSRKIIKHHKELQ